MTSSRATSTTTRTTARTAAALTAAALLTSACSLSGGGGDDDGDGGASSGGTKEVVLLTHDSFTLPDELIAAFEADTGYRLTIRESGEAGELTNRLVLSAGNPNGDAAFGIDNAFGGRAVAEGVFAPADVEWPAGVEQYALEGDDEQVLHPVDNGNVCVNIDTVWFDEQGIDPPRTLDDLTDPAYEDLFVTPGAATSSPGLSFLLATIAEYGEDWPAYWEDLVANGAKITNGWTDAYQVDFSQGGGGGDRPVVVSYDSSPAYTVRDGRETSAALLETCFLQVEYAGVLDGADNPEGGAAVVQWLLSEEVQTALPESMFVFPVSDEAELPRAWARYNERPTDPYTLDPAEIEEQRDDWLQEWTEVTTR